MRTLTGGLVRLPDGSPAGSPPGSLLRLALRGGLEGNCRMGISDIGYDVCRRGNDAGRGEGSGTCLTDRDPEKRPRLRASAIFSSFAMRLVRKSPGGSRGLYDGGDGAELTGGRPGRAPVTEWVGGRSNGWGW